jgi:hypothetical protein
MRIFFTREQISAPKAEWEPQLRAFAASTNAALRDARRLPIYDQAVIRASEWLEDALARVHRAADEMLIISGDEHLHAAATNIQLPENSLFLYRQAWRHWWSAVFRRGAPWWQEISWGINCTDRLIELAHPFDHKLQLIPNETYLCSEEVANRGTHSILRLVDDELVPIETFSEWVDSI